MSEAAVSPTPEVDPMVPEVCKLTKVIRETADTFTWDLDMSHRSGFAFAPGQFNMLYIYGIGEVPISISGDPARPETLTHTIRQVGGVTSAMARLKSGASVGIRGPFGTAWPVEEARGRDVVVVAGGIGLAPLRPAICHILEHRKEYGEVTILYGARSPHELLYPELLHEWRGRFDLTVRVTVDRGDERWRGNVGVVTRLFKKLDLDPEETLAVVCGPEIMMRFCIREFQQRNVPAENLYVSMERNMKCGVGFCGHCQYGGEFVCKDGPVFPFPRVERLFHVREA